jgi:hypothetical protein
MTELISQETEYLPEAPTAQETAQPEQAEAPVALAVFAWAATLACVLLFLNLKPTPSYSLSIYTEVPWQTWAVVLASGCLHILVALQVSLQQRPARISLMVGSASVAGLVVTTALVLLLPYALGYYLLKGDFGVHVSVSNSIADQGRFLSDNFYPALYALVQGMHGITGLGVREIWFLGSVLSYVMSVLVTCLAVRALFTSTRFALWAGLLSAVPIAGAYLRLMNPASVSVLMIPLLFYLYYQSRRSRDKGFRVLLVLYAFILPFLHPLTALMCIAWLSVLEVCLWLLKRFVKKRQDQAKLSIHLSKRLPDFNVNFILAITWFMWLSSFSLFGVSVRSIAGWLGGEADNQFAKLNYLIGRSGFTLFDTLALILKQESGLIVYVGLALLTIPIYRALFGNRSYQSGRALMFLSIYFVLFFSVLVAVIAPFGPFSGIDFYRFSRFLVPWSVLVLASIPLAYDRLSARFQTIARLALTASLWLTFAGGVLALHPSPFTFNPNDRLTVGEADCMQWLHTYGLDRPVKGVWAINSLAHTALGKDASASLRGTWSTIPEHFGYDQDGKMLSEPAYLLLTTYDEYVTLGLWQTANKFTIDDFVQLYLDPSAVTMYQNETCRIIGVGAQE